MICIKEPPLGSLNIASALSPEGPAYTIIRTISA